MKAQLLYFFIPNTKCDLLPSVWLQFGLDYIYRHLLFLKGKREEFSLSYHSLIIFYFSGQKCNQDLSKWKEQSFQARIANKVHKIQVLLTDTACCSGLGFKGRATLLPFFLASKPFGHTILPVPFSQLSTCLIHWSAKLAKIPENLTTKAGKKSVDSHPGYWLAKWRGKTTYGCGLGTEEVRELFSVAMRGASCLNTDAGRRCVPEELTTVYFVVVYKYAGSPRCVGQDPTKWLAIRWYNHSMWCKVLSQLCTIYHTDSFYIYLTYLNITTYTVFLLMLSSLRHKDKINPSLLILQQERKIRYHSLKSLLRQTVWTPRIFLKLLWSHNREQSNFCNWPEILFL